VSAVPTVFTTGLTGWTSNSESFELGRRVVGVLLGSGLSSGSLDDLSTVVAVDF
jgi:hypothetical protein